MILTLIAVVLGVILGNIFTLFVVNRVVKSKFKAGERRIRAEIASLVVSSGDGQSSPLAKLMGSLADVAGARLANQVQASIRGLFSGQSRQVDGVVGDVTQDMINQSSPIAGALISNFPVLGKRLRKHPELAMMAADFIQQKLAGLGKKDGNGTKPADSPRLFNL